MTTVAYDRVGQSGTYVSATPRVDLDGAAISGLVTFVTSVTTANPVQVLVYEDATKWAVWIATFADLATDTLTRVVELDSAGVLTNSATVECRLVNSADGINSAGLPNDTTSTHTFTTGNNNMIPGHMNECTISGTTGLRDAVCVAPEFIGQRMGIRAVTNAAATVGNELRIIGDTGISINGGTAATEHTRLFIQFEVLEFVATSLTNWDVVRDGRIPMQGQVEDQTGQTIANNTVDPVEHDTITINVGGVAAASTGAGVSGKLTARRAAEVIVHHRVVIAGTTTTWADGDNISSRLNLDAVLKSNSALLKQTSSGGAGEELRESTLVFLMAAGEVLSQDAFQNSGGTNPTRAATPYQYSALSMVEVLP